MTQMLRNGGFLRLNFLNSISHKYWHVQTRLVFVQTVIYYECLYIIMYIGILNFTTINIIPDSGALFVG